MHIELDLSLDPHGRLAGRLRHTGATAGVILDFSGNLELLARLEQLCQPPALPPPYPSTTALSKGTSAMITAPGLETLDAAAQQAVLTTLGALEAGFRARDTAQLIGVYSDDADWLNAFGSVKKGSAEILSYLDGLFADDNFNKGQLTAAPQTRLRTVGSDVVVASTHLKIRGQGLLDGSALDRDNHSLHVLHRQADGRWLIVSEMYNDANTTKTYAYHS